uniref:Ig-like domain-containing protein n=1 Tax=Laticauda laticaudata TaxID=8630 RepID=A0A8C5WVR1_LATLA
MTLGIEMFYELTVCLLGLHTWQNMYGCELRKDGSRGGFVQYGYNGKTFITFNKETLTWVAPDSLAQITQRKWDAIPGKKEKEKAYLEKICIEWLERYLSYGNETLLRREPPVVMVSNRTEVEDGMEMHICWIHGFYPREIDASWRRDGEVWLEDTLHGSVVSNADGTYHYWLTSLRCGTSAAFICLFLFHSIQSCPPWIVTQSFWQLPSFCNSAKPSTAL